jgi:hypothetical protein
LVGLEWRDKNYMGVVYTTNDDGKCDPLDAKHIFIFPYGALCFWGEEKKQTSSYVVAVRGGGVGKADLIGQQDFKTSCFTPPAWRVIDRMHKARGGGVHRDDPRVHGGARFQDGDGGVVR